MASITLPGVTEQAVSTVKELLAFTALPYYQISGILKSGEGSVDVGDVVAWSTTYKKFLIYNQAGSGEEATAVGFVRIPADSTNGDVAVEVVIGGAVKYSVVSAASNWHADVLTDLKARYVEPADAVIF